MINILLPVHNRREVTANFARALARQTIQNFRLLLIDDGSTDGTAGAVTDILPSKVTILHGTGNWWWGGSLHQGWRWLSSRTTADSDVICMCNDDVDLPDDFLERGIALLDKHPNSLAVARARDPQTNRIDDACFSVDFRTCAVVPAQPGDRNICAPTRGLLIRWRDMQRVGGFHPLILPHYLADLEWTFRAAQRGLEIQRDDSFWLVPHHEKTGVRRVRHLSFLARARHLFSKKFVPNPVYWCAFVILSFPPRYWLPAMARIARWTAGVLLGR
jgi:GT2 family glycosyltransferase